MGENSAPGCCGKRVPWVSIAQELPRNMRLSISRGSIPLDVFLLSFPLYATFVSVYLVFISLSLNKRIPADAKPLFPLNRDCVHVPPTFVPRYSLSLERLSHPTPAFTLGCVTIVPKPSTCPAEPPTNDPHGPALRRPRPATESASFASHDTDLSRFDDTTARSTAPSSATPWTKTNSTTTTTSTTPT